MGNITALKMKVLALIAAMTAMSVMATNAPSDNAQANAAELAKKLQNPIARTIMPVIHAESPMSGGSGVAGFGDVVQSFFLSPKEPSGGWTVGWGLVFLYPSASEQTLGKQKWGAGPTAVALKQQNGSTYGMLANHLRDFANNANRADINGTFMQPFASYTIKTYTTSGVNTESTYVLESKHWTVPLNLTAQQLVKFGSQPVAFTLGGRYYAEKRKSGRIGAYVLP